MRPAEIISCAEDRRDLTIDLRRWFHARPELAFEERETTEAIRRRLHEIGLSALPCPLDTGAVSMLEGGRPGRTVLVRADIDGLPIEEPEGLTFRSRHDGVMHACGHDAHAAIALGVADLLASRRDDLPGRYIFVFQPAEETVQGARAMIAGGVLDALPIDRAIALHVAGQGLPAGEVVSRPGVFTSAAVFLRITLTGSGGHGALTGAGRDVVSAACELVRRLDELVAGLTFDTERCRCTAGLVQAGRAANVIPDHAIVEATVRTFTNDQRRVVGERLERLRQEITAAFGVDVDVEPRGRARAVRNDRGATTSLLSAAASVLRTGRALTGPVITPSDDMGEFLARVPGCYFLLGAAPAGSAQSPHHSAGFHIDEGALVEGIKALAAGALALAADR